MEERYLPERQVRDRFGGVSDTTIKRWMQRGFPRPLKISSRNFWKLSELLAFERQLDEARLTTTQTKGPTVCGGGASKGNQSP